MCRMNALARDSVQAQERLFRLAKRDHNLSIPTLVLETKIPKSTLEGWRDGATMPAWAIGALGSAGVPDYLLSLVLNPFRKHVGSDGAPGEAALHDAATEASGFSQEYLTATSPESEGGTAITPREAARLAERAARAAGKLRAVA